MHRTLMVAGNAVRDALSLRILIPFSLSTILFVQFRRMRLAHSLWFILSWVLIAPLATAGADAVCRFASTPPCLYQDSFILIAWLWFGFLVAIVSWQAFHHLQEWGALGIGIVMSAVADHLIATDPATRTDSRFEPEQLKQIGTAFCELALGFLLFEGLFRGLGHVVRRITLPAPIAKFIASIVLALVALGGFILLGLSRAMKGCARFL
jgi:hypothetical protein